jgi:hypothetical protein
MVVLAKIIINLFVWVKPRYLARGCSSVSSRIPKQIIPFSSCIHDDLHIFIDAKQVLKLLSNLQLMYRKTAFLPNLNTGLVIPNN